MLDARRSTDLPEAEDAVATTYVFNPSLMGAPHEFRLSPDALEWQMGRHAGQVPYRDIRHVRLLYRPANLQTHRFVTEIHADKSPKLKILSVSWRSMLEQKRQDRPYSAFIVALHRRLANANPNVVFQSGTSPFLYWPGLLVFAALAVAIVFLIARGIQEGAWAGAAVVAAFLLFYLWQVGDFFRRNRPATYRPDEIPPAVLPSG